MRRAGEGQAGGGARNGCGGRVRLEKWRRQRDAGSREQAAGGQQMANAWMEGRLGQALGEVGVPAPTRVTWVDIAARYLA